MAGVTSAQVPTYDDVRAAAELIGSRVRRTPVVMTGGGVGSVVLKLELLQHSGSFKARGAFHSVLSAPETPAALVAASGGNHGLAVAYAGNALGIATRIFVPTTAPAMKVSAIAALGAQVDQVGATYAEALEASLEAAAGPEVLALHAYDSWGTVTGQGTLGLELAEQVPDVDTVLVAVGGGGLMAGVTTALAGALPGVKVVGVEPELCPALRDALAADGPVEVSVGGVAADALGASRLGEIAFSVARSHDVASVVVTDEEIVRARRALWRDLRLAPEPGGATAFAALLGGGYRPAPGEQVCVIVCGANADPSGLG